MTTTRHAAIAFDPSREATDGKGWHLTWYDQDAILSIAPVATEEYFTRFSNPSKQQYSINNKALTSNVVTLTTSVAHTMIVGQSVVVSGVGAPFDGNWVISAVASSTFSYALTNANIGTAAVSPVGTVVAPLAVSAGQTATVTNKALTTNVATLTLASNTFNIGDRVTITIGDTVFDGTYVLTASTKGLNGTIGYAKTNANVTSAAASGTAVTEMSLSERLKALFVSASDVTTYFSSAAQTALIAASTAALAATTTASITAEGLLP